MRSGMHQKLVVCIVIDKMHARHALLLQVRQRDSCMMFSLKFRISDASGNKRGPIEHHEGANKGSSVYRDVTIPRSCASSSEQTGKLVANNHWVRLLTLQAINAMF